LRFWDSQDDRVEHLQSLHRDSTALEDTCF
jgi:hypothetical protein